MNCKMKDTFKKLEDKFLAEIDDVSVAISKTIGDIEARLSDLENENKIITNQCYNLSNRIDYFEKKLLK